MAGCPNVEPCQPWVTEADLCCLDQTGAFPNPCLNEGTPVPQSQINNALNAASFILWRLSGMKYGKCQVKVRPCTDSCSPCGDDANSFDGFQINPFNYGYGGGYRGPALINGLWYNMACGCDTCCNLKCAVRLPSPICSIDEVKVDGVVLGKDSYKVYDFTHLQRNPNTISHIDHLSAATGPIGGPIVSASGDTVVTGPGVLSDGTGIVLPNDGGLYSINTGDRTDWMLEFDVPIGCPANDISFFGINGGEYDVTVLDGDVVVHGPVPLTQNITFPSSTVSGHRVKLRIRSTHPNALVGTPVNVQINNTCGLGGIRLLSTQWTVPAASAQCFPSCQQFQLNDTEIGTFSVTLTYGYEVPAMGKLAAAELACELLKSCVGAPCNLPQRTRTVTRQGISITAIDPMEFLKNRKTGLYNVDLFLNAVNPYNLTRRPAVWSPDVGPKWRVET